MGRVTRHQCGTDEVPPRRPDLLGRPPSDGPPPGTDWTPPLVDVVDQLEALAGLFTRGLLSDEEFDRQKRMVLTQRRHGAR